MFPSIKAAALIKRNRRFLLVHEKDQGLWNWPQGRVEEGESPEQAAAREAKEETGLDVRIEEQIALLRDTFPNIKQLHVFRATIVGGELDLPQDEIAEAEFFSAAEIDEMRGHLVGEWIADLISEVVKTDNSL